MPIEISFAPNPAKDFVSVMVNSGEEIRWRSFNLLGQLMASGVSDLAMFQIDVSRWESGVYVLEVESFGRRKVEKLAVSR